MVPLWEDSCRACSGDSQRPVTGAGNLNLALSTLELQFLKKGEFSFAKGEFTQRQGQNILPFYQKELFALVQTSTVTRLYE